MNNKNIKYKIAYFKKVLENMDNKTFRKSIEIDSRTELTDKIEEMCCSVDEYFCKNLLDWIEWVEIADLHKALKSLSVEEQTLLSYLYHKNKTQTELAKFYGISQKSISKKINRALNKIKKILIGN